MICSNSFIAQDTCSYVSLNVPTLSLLKFHWVNKKYKEMRQYEYRALKLLWVVQLK